METLNLNNLLSKGEGKEVEFKEAKSAMPGTLFETVCSFLNSDGGTIILGVNDHGKIKGIDRDKVSKIRSDIITASNNREVLDPPFLLHPEEIEKNNKKLLLIRIWSSSQVHTHKNDVYIRENDSDLVVSSHEQLSNLYLNKKNVFTENTIYPEMTIEDLDKKLFKKARKLISIKQGNHPWLTGDIDEFLRNSNLWRKDFNTGIEGLTLAAALLLGKDNTIHTILPAYKIDALVQIHNKDRWDDRLTLRTNLIDSYQELLEFIKKHLDEKFYTEGTQRMDLRELIFREVISNILVHREYTNANPTTLIINKDEVLTKNPNRPHFRGPIYPDNFSPFPKNPVLRKFFNELGWADEIGSGVKNINKYLKIYSNGSRPQFIEDDIFITQLPLNKYPFEDIADLIISILELPKEKIPEESYETLKNIGIHPKYRKNENENELIIDLISRWDTLGTKLDNIRFNINKDLDFSNIEDVPSSLPKGTKLFTKPSLIILWIMILLQKPLSLKNLMGILDYSNRKSFKDLYFNPLKKDKLIEPIIKDKIRSPKQKYVITEKGKSFLGGFEL
jgi:ATP-dependent DNA helicase RecG